MFYIISLIKAMDCNIQAYGFFHLGFYAIGIAIIVLLSYKLKKLDETQNDALLLIVGILFLVLEIQKQNYLYVNQGRVFDLKDLPFQLSSIPMYLCIVCYFIKPGIYKNIFYYFMATYTLLAGIVSFIEPSGIIHESMYLTMISFTWHMLLMFVGMYLIITKRLKKRFYNFKLSTGLFILFCLVALFVNLLMFEKTNGQMNLFLIGPGIKDLRIFGLISQRTSWMLSTMIYIACVIGGSFVIDQFINKFNQ